MKENRRWFGKKAAACLAACGITHRLSAMELPPIGDRHQSHIKLSLAAYSFREALQGKAKSPATMDLHQFIDRCAQLELDGVELTGYYMPEPIEQSYLHQLRMHCYRSGLEVSGTAIRTDFSAAAGTDAAKKELEHVQQWIQWAAALHAPFIRIFAGHHPKGVDPAISHQHMVTGMREASKMAQQQGIYLALENHGGPTETAEGLMNLVHDVDHPHLVVNLDTGNFRGDRDPYEQMEAVAPWAVNVQLKTVISHPDGTRKEIDLERLAGILQRTRYRGYVALEYEEPGDVWEACQHWIPRIRAALQTQPSPAP